MIKNNNQDLITRITDLTNQELEELRQAPPGSHIDIILKECLMDRDYANKEVPSNMWLFNSFPDLVDADPEGIIVRSEFLLLRYSGNKEFDFNEDYFDYTASIIEHMPKKVMYRLCDYNPEDLSFLGQRYNSRGAQRLIEQRELLSLDKRVIKQIESTGRDVQVLVPYVVFPEEFETVRKGFQGNVGSMLEVPSNLMEIDKFNANFYVFGPSDLTKNMYGGIDRNSQRYGQVNNDLIIPLVKECMGKIDVPIYLVKNLVGLEHPNAIDVYMPSQLVGGKK